MSGQLAHYVTAQQDAKYLAMASLAFIVYDWGESLLSFRTVPSPLLSCHLLSRGRPIFLNILARKIIGDPSKAGICMAYPSIHDCESIIPDKQVQCPLVACVRPIAFPPCRIRYSPNTCRLDITGESDFYSILTGMNLWAVTFLMDPTDKVGTQLSPPFWS